MMRGEDKIFRFKLPCNCDDLKWANVVFSQSNNNGPSPNRPLPIIKTLECREVSQNPTHFCVKLNSEETLRFSDRLKAYVQFSGQTTDGRRVVGQRWLFNIYPVVDDSIFDGEHILPTPTPNDEWIYLDGAAIIEE